MESEGRGYARETGARGFLQSKVEGTTLLHIVTESIDPMSLEMCRFLVEECSCDYATILDEKQRSVLQISVGHTDETKNAFFKQCDTNKYINAICAHYTKS